MKNANERSSEQRRKERERLRNGAVADSLDAVLAVFYLPVLKAQLYRGTVIQPGVMAALGNFGALTSAITRD